MTDFGDKLRELRESRDVTLEELSESTKIGKRYLQALERNDFGALPGGVFAKGYIRTCAEYLGVDPEPLLADYRRERESRGEGDSDQDERAAREAAQAALSQLAGTLDSTPATRPRRGAKLIVLGIAGLGAVAVLAWILFGVLGTEPQEGATVEAESVVTQPAAVAREQAVEARPVEERPATPPPVRTEEPIVSAEPAAAPETAEAEPPPTATPTTTETEPAIEQVAESVVQRPAEPTAPAAALTERSEEPAETVEPTATSELSVAEFGVGTGVENRQLVGRSDRFAEGTRVTFWNRVIGGRPGDRIEHVWIYQGRAIGRVPLAIGGSHWRTQSRWTLRQGRTGAWAVEARDAAGRVLVREEFTCVAAE
jgi:cytoskeletal protein RodZ